MGCGHSLTPGKDQGPLSLKPQRRLSVNHGIQTNLLRIDVENSKDKTPRTEVSDAVPEDLPNEDEFARPKVLFGGTGANNVAEVRAKEEESTIRRASAFKEEDDQLFDEMFLFSDFAVAMERKPKKKLKKDEKGAVETILEEEIVKHYLEAKYFQYSDFNVNLEEVILNPVGSDDGPHTNDMEAYRFAFGDFRVGVTEEQMKLANASNKRNPIMTNYEMYNLLGHSTRVKCICINPTEKHYVSSSAKDATIVMYDLNTGKEILYFEGHEDTIIGAQFSSDCKHLATASRDNNLILWDTVIGKQIFVFEHERIVICCCFSRDGKTIVSGCQDKVCRVWSTKKGKELLAFKGHEGIITALSFSPDNDFVVSASSDRTLKIWSPVNGICSASISEHQGIVMACNYSSDGAVILSNDERVVSVWNVKKMHTSMSLNVDNVPCTGLSRSEPNAKKRTFTMTAFCPGRFGWLIVAATSDRHVRIINPHNKEVLLSFFCKAAVYCLSSGPREKLALGDAFGNIYVVTFTG